MVLFLDVNKRFSMKSVCCTRPTQSCVETLQSVIREIRHVIAGHEDEMLLEIHLLRETVFS